MSLNTHPHHFRFALRETVRVIASGLVGTVIAQSTSLHAQEQFQVQFHGTNGNPASDWLFADQLEHFDGVASSFVELMKAREAHVSSRVSQYQEGVNIDAAHQAEARAEDTAVAQANVAADTPKPIFFSLSTPKLPIDPRKSNDSFVSLGLGHSNASVSLYIPDIAQKPGESLTDFLLRAAAALQGQAATL